MRAKTGQWGFTLVEVMIVVAIIGILAGIAMTVLLKSLPNMRLRGTARDIYSTMMLAKSEALRRGENVTLLFNSPLPGGAPGGTYILFLDNGAGGGIANNEVREATETVLVSLTILPDRVTFDPTVGGGDGVTFANNAMVFTSRGVPISATALPGTFTLGLGSVGLRATDPLGNTVRQRVVAVSSAGRISIQ